MLVAEQFLTMQSVATLAEGEAVLEDEILPFFQQGRSAVPVERMLEDDELVIAEGLLLGGDVDVEIEVLFVQILKCHTRQISYRIDESSIDP